MMNDLLAPVLLLLMAVIVVLIPLWVMVEVVVPVFIYMIYVTIRQQLSIVAKLVPRCEGRPLLAGYFGVLWATIYTSPVALAVWGLHAVAVTRGFGTGGA